MPAAQILVVDDEPDIRELVKDILEDEGYRVRTAEHAAAARRAISEQLPDAILLDIWMPGTDGVALLREWSEGSGLPCPVLMMSGHGTVETAVEATRLGAWDFIEKPISLAKLLISLQRALEAGELKKANAALRQQLTPSHPPVGESPPMRSLRAQLQRIAGHATPVLLQGEAGTRKEALARWIHQLSPRRHAPFVTVAAGAVADEQAAATLFGRENGEDIEAGLLEQAQGGSLFLDDLAALSPEMQLRLSVAIERRQCLRVGGRNAIDLDVRVIAASGDDLEVARSKGRLRDELYYLIAVVPVHVPSLRERREDIPLLVQDWVERMQQRDGLTPRLFPPAALKRLAEYDWPGNLRELHNLLQRLLLLGDDGEVAVSEIDHAFGNTGTNGQILGGDGASIEIDFSLPLREAREQFERGYLLHQLHNAGGSVGKLAKLAGMERTHLYRKLKELGVDIRAGKET